MSGKSEYDILKDEIFELFKKRDFTYLDAKQTLDDCLILLEVRAKVF